MILVKFGYSKNKRWYAIFGKLIQAYERYTTGLDASHSYVDVYSEKDVFRIESTYPHGRISKNRDFGKKYQEVESYCFFVNAKIEEVIEWAKIAIEGKKYSLTQNIMLAAIGLVMKALNSKNWDLEQREFNGRVRLNCTEAQIMFLAKFLGAIPTEGFDNFSVGEARDLVRSVWELKGTKNVNTIS